MIVIGGSYSETVVYPKVVTEFMGSGLRAASTLAADAEKFITIAAPEEVAHIEAKLAPAVVLETLRRERPVEFRYLDPALTPTVLGVSAEPGRAHIFDCADSDVLAFGLAELPNGYAVKADRIVVDPQAPRAASQQVLESMHADQIAICANRSEARRMTGLDSPIESATALLALPGVEAVVVKCGALGFVTADAAGVIWSHASPTLAVRTLGSGDVFSSVFAREWFAGESALDAASTASSAVAASVAGETTASPRVRLPLQPGYAPKIYLAGPFFTLSERWLIERARATLVGLGARVFSPIHDVGPGDIEVAQKDLDGLDDCDVVFALLDGFDPGTIYETGWAARGQIPVVGFGSEQHFKETKMLVGMGAEVHTDLTTAMYRAIWAGQGAILTPGIHSIERDE